MARIFPFHAYRYDSSKVRLDDVLTQPYDKISPETQDRYYAASPFNLIPVEKGKSLPADNESNNVYSRAAQSLNEWIADGVLVRDNSPGIYVYAQEYVAPGSTESRVRRGFIALSQLEDYSAGVVHRHELTLSGPKADRLELLRQTRAQTGLLFMLYSDPARKLEPLLDQICSQPPVVSINDEFGVAHRLWPVFDSNLTAEFVARMADQKLVIADGHHRYETALAYRDECRAKAAGSGLAVSAEKVMMAFFNSDVPGLTILPGHRVLANIPQFDFNQFNAALAKWFDHQAISFSSKDSSAVADFRRKLAEQGKSIPAVGIYAGNGTIHLYTLRRDCDLNRLLPGLSPAQHQLDVVLLHRLILEQGLGITAEAVKRESHITYEREISAALAAVDSARAQICCLLNPVAVEKVVRMALDGEVLPQKSTDFYPKLLSGLTIYRLDDSTPKK
ncbi:MAG: DUF1015 domain-containing protein [Acidobacteria bacterium]|nr:DUF1015 domain-containing protein [Acidobacteriota bacterium]